MARSSPLAIVAAPLWAALIAGRNGANSAGIGWDACTGLGVPVGTALPGSLSSASGGG